VLATPAPDLARTPDLGAPIRPGAGGVAKRLDAMRRLRALRGRRLLDVGCGNGAYTLELARGFDEAIGIDVEPDRLEAFRRALREPGAPTNVSVVQGSAERLPFPDAFFDLVTAIEVLEHVAALDDALAEIRRVLAPGGAFVVTVPNRLFPIETHNVALPVVGREVAGRWVPFLPWFPPLHRRIASARNFTAAELRARVERAGFEQIGVDWVMPPFDGWSLGRRWLKPLTERLERGPGRVFGVSIVAGFRPR
jgi:ubiquinone/menaquinone biosynthesis C-methylase UbiE